MNIMSKKKEKKKNVTRMIINEDQRNISEVSSQFIS